MARPTKLTPELEQQARDYIVEYEKYEHIMPSVVGMAVVINIAKSTLYDWASQEGNPFSDILEECTSCQELLLIKNGLNGEFNSNITKLVLGKHGYSDKSEVKAEINAHEDLLDIL